MINWLYLIVKGARPTTRHDHMTHGKEEKQVMEEGGGRRKCQPQEMHRIEEGINSTEKAHQRTHIDIPTSTGRRSSAKSRAVLSSIENGWKMKSLIWVITSMVVPQTIPKIATLRSTPYLDRHHPHSELHQCGSQECHYSRSQSLKIQSRQSYPSLVQQPLLSTLPTCHDRQSGYHIGLRLWVGATNNLLEHARRWKT